MGIVSISYGPRGGDRHFHGGSAALCAVFLEHINPAGRVITIDIEDRRSLRARRLLKTTMIYTHVTKSGPYGVTSPADRL